MSQPYMYDPDGPTYRITTERLDPDASAVPVKSYGQVLREYRIHPEHKFNGPDGQRCHYLTRGLLQRRAVDLAGTAHPIGKEANKLDEVKAGLHADLADVVSEYPRPNTVVLQRQVLPVLERYSGRRLAALVGTDRRTIDCVRQGQQPRSDLRVALLRLAARTAQEDLGISSGRLQCTSGDAVAALQLLAAWLHEADRVQLKR